VLCITAPLLCEAQKHRTAAPCLMKLRLGREVLERRERAATLRCFEVVMLLTLSVLVFLASAAMAQVPEINPPILSSASMVPSRTTIRASPMPLDSRRSIPCPS